MIEDVTLLGRSKTTGHNGLVVWILEVADQIVEAQHGWSEPVQFMFERREDGRLEMWLRNVQ